MRKTYYASTKLELNSLINSYKEDKNKLWEIPVSPLPSADEKIGAIASLKYIAEQLSCSYEHYFRSHKESQSQITHMMKKEGIIIENQASAILEVRRQLINWWNSLTEQDKKNLKVYGNQIQFAKYIKGYPRFTSQKVIVDVINEINQEVTELGILNINYINKLKTEEVKNRLHKLLNTYQKDSNLLWNIPVSNSSSIDVIPNVEYFCEEIGCTRMQLHKYSDLIIKIKDLMIEEGIIIDGHIAAILNARREMISWWNSLSLEDKKNLEHFGNKIQFQKYLSLWRGTRGDEILEKTADSFHNELIDIGLLKDDYVITKERLALRDKKFIPQRSANVARWEELEKLPLDYLNDLIPANQNLEDYIQVKQLFVAQMKTVPSNSSKSNYQDAFKHFSQFLKESNIPKDSQLKDIMHPFILTRFKKDYLAERLEQKAIAPKTTPGILSAIRRSLKRATKIKKLGFPSFYDVDGFDISGRATNLYKPYSNMERAYINKAILDEIKEAKTLLKPYEKANIGENPLDPNGHIKAGFGTIDNARYLFENHLDCKPVFYGENNTVEGEVFLRIIQNTHKGLHKVYKSWGIMLVHKDIITPFILRLAQITGMNADSLYSLEFDDFILKHSATNKPCLRYWKERSGGEKEYHLDLFKAELQWLTVSQSKDVFDIFETVKKITSKIRHRAPKEIAKKLFIYESNGAHVYGEIYAVNNNIYNSIKNFVKKHNLVDEDGKTTQLNIARFRPSFVSDMITKGVSIREIQLMLGHKSIMTTMGYLDRLDYNQAAREKVQKALTEIHNKVLNPKVKDSGTKKYIENEDNIIFKTPLAGCSNIFQPPKFIKESKLFVEGQACSQFNKCLSCDNVMLISAHLPELFAMKRDYMILLQRNRIMDTPYGVVIEENLFLLDEILSPDSSDFTQEELEKGEELSQFVETAFIDGVAA